MGRWQQEYERRWRSYNAAVLRASDAAPPYASYTVTAADVDALQAVLRALGSQTDVHTLRPAKRPPRSRPEERSALHRQRRRRQSSVRFTTPLVTAEDSGAVGAYLPMTQVLQDDDPMASDVDVDSGSGSERDSDDGSAYDSDASMKSDESYVYRTPQPKLKTRRRSSTSFRSSTSTFPAFTPQDLRHSLDQGHRESASQSLRHRLAGVSPIGPARLRFSVDSALNACSRGSITVLEDSGAELCDTIAMQSPVAMDATRRLTMGLTPRPAPVARERREEEEEEEHEPAMDPTTPDVGELDVSMQSMHLSEDHSFRDDGEIEMDTGREADADPSHERSSPGIVLSEALEKERAPVERPVATQLDFNDASDDDEEQQIVGESAALSPRKNPPRWRWSAGSMQDPASQRQQQQPEIKSEPPEIIVIDDDEMVGNTEESGETNGRTTEATAGVAEEEEEATAEAVDDRLQRAGLRLSDDEPTVNPTGRATAVERRTTAQSSSRPSATSRSRNAAPRSVFRTKLPLPVETYYSSVDERRRRRRRQLEDKIAAATASTVLTVPELRVTLAPYQRKAVDWMLERERFPKRPAIDDGTCSTESGSDGGGSNRQRAAYYARLTDKVRGGILADEMGLGKTICCIAMICESLRAERERLDSEGASDSGPSNEDSGSSDGPDRRRLPRLSAPTLIITPLSILSQWEREIRDKTNLSVMTYQGQARKQLQSVVDFMGVDVVLSTYDTLRLKECKVSSKRRRQRGAEPDGEDNGNDLDGGSSDEDPAVELLNQQLDDSTEWRTSARRLSASKKAAQACKLHQLTWHRVILDESHLITNASCARAKAAFALKSRRRWCVTGTPFQNSGRDLSALLGFLGVDALSPHDDALGRGDLQRILSHLMLRRFKSTVDAVTREPIVQLPTKIEETIELEFQSDLEKAYYTLLHHSTKRQVMQYLGRRGGSGRSRRAPSGPSTQQHFMHVFELLLRLRQCCNASELVTNDAVGEIRAHEPSQRARVGSLPRAEAELLQRALASEAPRQPSTKIQALLREIAAAKSAGERVLVISQWTSFLDLVGDAIDAENARASRAASSGAVVFGRLDGRMSSREREQVVATFQHERRLDVLLVSLRTGGLGLNLTAASQVFIMEPSWNPSIETQAVDRAHRVGQFAARVRVVRFLMRGTIEERVVALQERKRRLAAHALGDSSRTEAAPIDKEPTLSRDDLRELFTQDPGCVDAGDEDVHDDSCGQQAPTDEDDEAQREKDMAADDSSHSHLRVEEAIWDDMD
ncbi:hypothetical protein P43SY_010090 [Pythium insidiosum]|uniref:Uncharacterized protein n=1 Tax=Pythium insidiosum TaxID=114742 RepID=A0AAD5Q8U8_PYTIN|nr:hypothetical protein P43SY_010090 [Pythium insidiosum]